jgi:transcription-repair coupling factor (superfamily II helicase)
LELRNEEFPELFAEAGTEDDATDSRTIEYINDCQIDTDLELMFPDDYIRNVSERIRLYRELDNTETEEKLQEFAQQLTDRFGPIPEPTKELLQVVRLRWMAKKLGFEKLIIKNGKLYINFIANQMSAYYQSPVFDKIIRFVQNNPRIFQMKETKEKLTMSAENVTSISKSIEMLNNLYSFGK